MLYNKYYKFEFICGLERENYDLLRKIVYMSGRFRSTLGYDKIKSTYKIGSDIKEEILE